MLTISINIEDEHLANRLLQEAEANGKSVDELIKEIVDEQFPTPYQPDFEIPRRDVREDMEVIRENLTEEEKEILAQNPDVRPFSHIDDPAQYIHDLRRKPRY